MRVYIPCYFNGIEDREQNFFKVLRQYSKLGYEVVVYWMNEKLPIKITGVEYILSEQMNASKARNKLLEIFYESSEEDCFLSDDDTILNNRIPLTDLDCVSYTNDYNTKLKKTEEISTSFLYIKNFKKTYGISPFFDECLEANQDLDFGISLNRLGIQTFRKSSTDVEIFKGVSSMFKSNMSKINKKRHSLDYINKKYGRHSKKNI